MVKDVDSSLIKELPSQQNFKARVLSRKEGGQSGSPVSVTPSKVLTVTKKLIVCLFLCPPTISDSLYTHPQRLGVQWV